MADKKKQISRPASTNKEWFFPDLGVTVQANTLDEAIALVNDQKKDEEVGDGN